MKEIHYEGNAQTKSLETLVIYKIITGDTLCEEMPKKMDKIRSELKGLFYPQPVSLSH